MVLNSLRERLGPALERMGKAFATTGLSANFWTATGLAFAFAAAIIYGSYIEYAFIIGACCCWCRASLTWWTARSPG